MKKTTLLLSLLVLLTSVAHGSQFEKYCTRGENDINTQEKLIAQGFSEKAIDEDLKIFLESSLVSMQANYDYLCLNKELPSANKKSYKEKQLDLIKEGLESGELSPEQFEYFLKAI